MLRHVALTPLSGYTSFSRSIRSTCNRHGQALRNAVQILHRAEQRRGSREMARLAPTFDAIALVRRRSDSHRIAHIDSVGYRPPKVQWCGLLLNIAKMSSNTLVIAEACWLQSALPQATFIHPLCCCFGRILVGVHEGDGANEGHQVVGWRWRVRLVPFRIIILRTRYVRG